MFSIILKDTKSEIMFQNKLSLILLFIFSSLLIFQSCKTDPASNSGNTTADDSFTVVSRLVGEPNMFLEVRRTTENFLERLKE